MEKNVKEYAVCQKCNILYLHVLVDVMVSQSGVLLLNFRTTLIQVDIVPAMTIY